MGILFLHCVVFWLAIYVPWSRSTYLLPICGVEKLPNKSLANNYSELFKQKPWAKGWVQDVWLPLSPLHLLTQQLFQGPPPGSGSVRSLMESAGSKLTHEKRANKSLQLLVSSPGWLALQATPLLPFLGRLTFPCVVTEEHRGQTAVSALPGQSGGLWVKSPALWPAAPSSVGASLMHYSPCWVWVGLTTYSKSGLGEEETALLLVWARAFLPSW